MMAGRKIFRQGHIVMPLRLYHVLSTILILGASCLLSSILVYALGSFSDTLQSMPVAFAVCSVLTMALGSIGLVQDARRYIRPAKDVMAAAARVSAGDFTVQIPMPKWRIGIAEGELLIENFNRMTQELRSMERMQKDFMGSASHEFKTPLSSIIGFTELLMDGGIDEKEQREYLTLVHEEARRLSRLSENILRLSRLDAQAIVHQELVDVDEQIRRCLILLTEKFSDKEQALDIQLEEIAIRGDADLLEQLWLNLIDNALKYSSSGKTLHIMGKTEKDTVVVNIREGIGIPPEKQERIWDRFYQCEESHKEQGHGLGLSIVKRIVELLGGSIECHSKVGQGTEMRVKLPKDISQKIPEKSH